MRVLKTTIVIALAIPAFLAFQIAADPLLLCGSGSYKIVLCEPGDEEPEGACSPSEANVEPAGCCRMVPEAEPEPESCCAKIPEPKPRTGGCCGTVSKKITFPNSCCPANFAAPSPLNAAFPRSGGCSIPGTGTDQDDEKCFVGAPPCCVCLPLKSTTDRAYEAEYRRLTTQDLPAAEDTELLMAADRQRAELHAHSPPLPTLARAGLGICIEKCSFLL